MGTRKATRPTPYWLKRARSRKVLGQKRNRIRDGGKGDAGEDLTVRTLGRGNLEKRETDVQGRG